MVCERERGPYIYDATYVGQNRWCTEYTEIDAVQPGRCTNTWCKLYSESVVCNLCGALYDVTST
eukprot:8932101-Pyramimonas_sp.AAC.1